MLAVVVFVLLGATLSYEVDTEVGPPESSRKWVRVVPFFIDVSLDYREIRRPVFRERWSLFGLVHEKRQVVFINK